MTTQSLTQEQRSHVTAAIEQTLRDECPEIFAGSEAGHLGGWAELKNHIDDLVAIARRTSADRIEPYLAQILEEICGKCAHAFPSGYCPLRDRGLCLLYRQARPILRAIVGALCEIQDPEYGATHGGNSVT